MHVSCNNIQSSVALEPNCSLDVRGTLCMSETLTIQSGAWASLQIRTYYINSTGTCFVSRPGKMSNLMINSSFSH